MKKKIFRLKNVELSSKNNELQTLYNTIATISEIGRDITSTLDLEEVFRKYTTMSTPLWMPLFLVFLFTIKRQSLLHTRCLCLLVKESALKMRILMIRTA